MLEFWAIEMYLSGKHAENIFCCCCSLFASRRICHMDNSSKACEWLNYNIDLDSAYLIYRYRSHY